MVVTHAFGEDIAAKRTQTQTQIKEREPLELPESWAERNQKRERT